MSYPKAMEIYKSDYFHNYSTDQIDGKRNRIFSHVLNRLDSYIDVGKILDVGAGCGEFLHLAKLKGWKICGIDPSADSIKIAKKKYGIEIHEGSLMSFPTGTKFDVITFINVLDHSVEPWSDILKAKSLLNANGVIYLRFPNGYVHSGLLRASMTFGVDKKAYPFLVFHLFSFTPRFIRRFLGDAGFEKVRIFNAPPSQGDPHHLFQTAFYAQIIKSYSYLISKSIEKLSFNKIFIGSSLEVFA